VLTRMVAAVVPSLAISFVFVTYSMSLEEDYAHMSVILYHKTYQTPRLSNLLFIDRL
jgi:hypothetical protein